MPEHDSAAAPLIANILDDPARHFKPPARRKAQDFMQQKHILDHLRGMRLDGMPAALTDTGTPAAAEEISFDH